jgi:hypothetical protein
MKSTFADRSLSLDVSAPTPEFALEADSSPGQSQAIVVVISYMTKSVTFSIDAGSQMITALPRWMRNETKSGRATFGHATLILQDHRQTVPHAAHLKPWWPSSVSDTSTV